MSQSYVSEKKKENLSNNLDKCKHVTAKPELIGNCASNYISLRFSRIPLMYFLADRILEQEVNHMKTLDIYYVVFGKVT